MMHDTSHARARSLSLFLSLSISLFLSLSYVRVCAAVNRVRACERTQLSE